MAEPPRIDLRLDPEDRRPSLSAPRRAAPRPRPDPAPPRRREREGGESGGERRKARRRSFGGILLHWGFVASVWGMVLASAVILYAVITLPETGDLTASERRPGVTLLAADGSLLATYGDLFGEALRLGDMPKSIPEAVIATEDRRFYYHFGIDLIGLFRAAVTNMRAGRVVQGGSTITQQLAKNLFLTPERSFQRKLQEALLAIWLERKFTKEQLLEIYLNRIYLGSGTYGVDAAARRYFGKSARQATLFEAAVIAGLPKAPTRLNPAQSRDRAAKRAEQVLANMVDAGFLTEAEAASAQRQSIQLAGVVSSQAQSRYFADWVSEQINGFGGFGGRDLIIRTTLDPAMQAAAERAVSEILSQEGAKAGVSEGALVAMAPDGSIRALVGGRNYGESQFNRATQALRQPGSAFKPFVYLAGLEAGLRPDEHLTDGPFSVGGWQPHNYTGRYLGSIPLSEALAQSVNTVAVQVEMRAGISRVAAAAHRLGITSELTRDASLALGTSDVTLLELTTAYAAFASGGVGAFPHGIAEITDKHGVPLFRRKGSGPGRVIPPEIAGEMVDMMAGVITRGTGKAAAFDHPAAGKTGTTQEYRDALFVGFTADLVAGVWLGNDDNTPMTKVTGGSLPAKIWRSFMVEATKTMPPRPLPTAPSPSGFSLDGIFSAISGGTPESPSQN